MAQCLPTVRPAPGRHSQCRELSRWPLRGGSFPGLSSTSSSPPPPLTRPSFSFMLRIWRSTIYNYIFLTLQSIALIPDWLGLRFRVRYIRISDCTKDTVSCFCGTEILGPVCANSGTTESGIRVIDCIFFIRWLEFGSVRVHRKEMGWWLKKFNFESMVFVVVCSNDRSYFLQIFVLFNVFIILDFCRFTMKKCAICLERPKIQNWKSRSIRKRVSTLRVFFKTFQKLHSLGFMSETFEKMN